MKIHKFHPLSQYSVLHQKEDNHFHNGKTKPYLFDTTRRKSRRSLGSPNSQKSQQDNEPIAPTQPVIHSQIEESPTSQPVITSTPEIEDEILPTQSIHNVYQIHCIYSNFEGINVTYH